MKLNTAIYSVELAEKEIRTITTALQAVYKDIRENIKDRIANETDDPKEMQRLHRDLDDIRTLRDGFADLIGINYTGEKGEQTT